MNLFYPFNKQVFLEAQDQKEIIDAIREAETQTSGEIRLYLESHCKYVNPLDRAAEIFWNLRMDETKDRNGVLIYIALNSGKTRWLPCDCIFRKIILKTPSSL